MNSAENATVTVTVAPGDGRVARRANAVLFDPTGNNGDLIAAFDGATTDADAISAIKRQLMGSDFSLAPLSMITWHTGELNLMVWGDVAVHSSIPAAPMITGAGSASWVERRLGALELSDVTDIALWCGDDVDQATDLRLGIVRCGGVQVALETPTADHPSDVHEKPGFVAPSSELAGSPEAAPLVDEVEEEPEVVADQIDELADAESSSVMAPPGAGPPPPAFAPSLSSPPPPPPPQAPPPQAPTPPLSPPASAPSMPSPPTPASADTFASSEAVNGTGANDEPNGRGVGLVEAALCSSGHTNRPQSVVCATCGGSIGPDAPAVLVDQPTVGQLVFLDGQKIDVDGALVLGRRPSVEPGQAGTVAIDQAEVSRSHASIAVEGWAAFVTDLGSRNGTFVCPPDNPTPVRLEAGVQHLLEAGTTVHLGGSEASFTFVDS